MKVFYTVFLFFMVSSLFSQVAINSNGDPSDSSAILDVKSTSRGLLIPRMTASERDAIMRPANGLLIFCTDNDRLYVNQGTPGNKRWVMMGNEEAIQDSLNDRYRRSDTSVVLLSRQRASIEYEPVITQGTATQYLDGNKHWAVLSTKVVPEDSVSLYFTPARVRNTTLTGLIIANDTVKEADSLICGIGKLQGQINSKQNALITGSVTAGSNKITLTGTPVNSIIGTGFSIDVVPSEIDHNALLHYDATQHFFQKTIDTLNTALSGLVKATTGKLTAIADNSSNWDTGYAYRLTSATATAPLILTLASNGLTGSLPPASATDSGYLTSTDWTTFNNKQNALITGSVTAGSNKIAFAGTPANSVIGPGFSIDVVPLNIDHNELLHYNAKQHFFQKTIDTVNTALSGLVKATTGKLTVITDNSSNWDAGYAYRLTTATATAPLTLTLASNGLTGSIPPASGSANGYLKSTDWTTFNSKQNALGYTPENQTNKSTNTNLGSSDILYPTQNAVKTYVNGLSNNYIANSNNLQTGTFHITGNGWIQSGNLGIGTTSVPTFQLDINGTSNVMRIQTLPVNSTNTSVLVVDDLTGVISKRTNGFNSGTVTSVTASLPLSSTGGTAPNISISQATSGTSGYLSSADWATFNGKENGLTFNSPLSRAGNTITLQPASGSQNGYLSNSDYARLHGNTGSILFYDGNGIQQDNSNCYFDNSNNRLGIGTNNPQASLAVGASSQFQVASDGHCTVTGAFGSISPITGINTTGTGVTGTGTVYGVYGQSTTPAGERAGGYFYTSSSAYARVGGFKQSSPGVFEAFLIWGIGKLVTQNKSPDGSMADMYAPVCPETVITDYGTGQLKNGRCHIEIDPLITKRIFVSREYPVKVFIQPEEDCKGVYVANKSASGFDVIELMGGTSDAAFSWSFTANINDVTSADGSVESKNIGVRSTEYITKNALK